jgi:hypothetical protein
MERLFNLQKLNVAEGKEKCRTEVSNRFEALEDFDAEVQNNARNIIRVNIKISAKESLGFYELKKHKRWLTKDAQNY